MDDEPELNREIADATVREIAEAVGRYADSWSSTEGALVTRVCVIAEVATLHDSSALLQIYSNGEGKAEEFNWKHKGMLFDVLHDSD